MNPGLHPTVNTESGLITGPGKLNAEPTSACDLAEGNEEDCIGSPASVCGDCLWARGM